MHKTDGSAIVSSAATWDISKRCTPDQWEHITRCHPSVKDVLAHIDANPHNLIAKSVKPYERTADGVTFVKPVAHARAHYVCFEDGVTLAVKGSEVLVDRNAIGNRVENASSTILHWFTLVEGIAPYVHVHAECTDECEKAYQAQMAHLEKFNCLAPIPIPLFVFRVPDIHWEAYKTKMKERIANNKYLYDKFLHNVREEDGLGVYVYMMLERPYPRVLHATVNPARPITSVDEYKTFVERHTRNVFKLLLCGYFCVHLAGGQKGMALQPQNVIFPSGGFVDVDSLTHVSDVDAAYFPDLIRVTFEALSYTMFCVLHGTTLDDSHHPVFHERVNAFTQTQQLQLPLVLTLYRRFAELRDEYALQGHHLPPAVEQNMFEQDYVQLIATRDMWRV